jgi:MFS family permease
MSGFPLFAERRFTRDAKPFGPKQVGYVYAYVGFLGIILQGGLIGRLVKAFGERKLATACFFLFTVGTAALGFTYSIPWLLVVAALSGIGSGGLRPALTSLITQKAARSEQGTVLGLTQSLMSISQITAPFIAGLLITRYWLHAWALLGAGVSAAALFL